MGEPLEKYKRCGKACMDAMESPCVLPKGHSRWHQVAVSDKELAAWTKFAEEIKPRRPKRKGRRPVHYAASGGSRFYCLVEEMRAFHASKRQVYEPKEAGRGYRFTVYDLFAPKAHTDLHRVTCPQCWKAIEGMVQEFKKGGLA